MGLEDVDGALADRDATEAGQHAKSSAKAEGAPASRQAAGETEGPAVTMEKIDLATDGLVADAAADAMAVALKAAAAPQDDSKSVRPRRFDVQTDQSRDELLTEFGKDTLTDRYLLPGESYQDLFARVADCLCRRCRARPAALRLYLAAVVHAGDAGAVEWGHRSRPADQLLPQFGV